MENASKALILAASVLLGLMIISVGVVLFHSFGGTGNSIMSQIEDNKIQEFNNQFLKYYGLPTGISIHDIITIANNAKNFNETNGIDTYAGYSDKSLYIQVDFKDKYANYINFEKKPEQEYINLLKQTNNADLYIYEIKSININPNTKRINYVKIGVKP